MQIVLVVLGTITAIFIVWVLIGMILASRLGSNKQRRANALFRLSQLSTERRMLVTLVYLAYKNGHPEEANQIIGDASAEDVIYLLKLFSYDNRPENYKSGFAGNAVWIGSTRQLMESGYSEAVSRILTGVLIDNYSEVLDTVIERVPA